jgi:2-keto-4-pentenoate hydratase/2-oxohepta-3-ene-1,7-dioic acid hydratase in catechol pathway
METDLKSIAVGNRIVTPSKIVCVGRNYVEHIEELGNEIPEDMVIFLKPNSAISEELKSTHQEPLHYEGELCFLFENGRFSAVGFGLDLTKRGLQSKLKAKGLPWERAKAFDGSALFSDFVEIAGVDPTLTVELDINGENIQSGDVGLMMYEPEQILAEILTFMSLDEGDIVMTGTPKGVGVVKTNQVFTGKVIVDGAIITSVEWLAK